MTQRPTPQEMAECDCPTPDRCLKAGVCTAGDLRSSLLAARRQAQNDGVPVRRSDLQVYALLDECLGICEKVTAQGMLDELRELVKQEVPDLWGRNRRYTSPRSDVYVLVSRFVLEGKDNRNSVYRYASAMRQAHKKGVQSGELIDWLVESGGIVQLTRFVEKRGRVRSVKVLYLDTSIQYEVGEPVTLVLNPTAGGRFTLVSQSSDRSKTAKKAATDAEARRAVGEALDNAIRSGSENLYLIGLPRGAFEFLREVYGK